MQISQTNKSAIVLWMSPVMRFDIAFDDTLCDGSCLATLHFYFHGQSLLKHKSQKLIFKKNTCVKSSIRLLSRFRLSMIYRKQTPWQTSCDWQ